jgi:hypothetical protein
MPVELPDTSWHCPLHWLQTFSNDRPNDDDARAPVPTRNQAVGTAAECHGRGFLSTSLKSLLGKQNEWQTVSYEGSDTYARVLDWPEKDLELQGRP